jgi:hypothetical protein
VNAVANEAVAHAAGEGIDASVDERVVAALLDKGRLKDADLARARRLQEETGALLLVQGPGRVPAKLVGDDRVAFIGPNGARSVLLLVRGADGRVEYLHQGLRALARQP